MVYRLAIMGAEGVGKSSLTIKYIENNFMENYDPTIEDTYRKQVEVGGVVREVEILDTTGVEENRELRERYLTFVEGVLLVYSITSRDSFEQIDNYVENLLKITHDEQIPMILVATKCDLIKECWEIKRKEGEEKARKWGIDFIETSAKEGVNVNECFFELVVGIQRGYDEFGRPRKPTCTLL